MKRTSTPQIWLLPCLIILLFTARNVAAVPGSLSYQGYLTDTIGNPLNTTVSITFNLYNVDSGGAPSWTGAQSVSISRGLFTVELGGLGNPLPATLFDNPVWLGIIVGADGEMTPRQPLTSVGFAFRAERAENDADSLANLSCSPTEVAKWNGTSWGCAEDAGSTTATPSGAVMFFNLTSCPAGWSPLAAASGRMIVAVGGGGSVGSTVGTALGDLESRGHNHVVDTPNLDTNSSGNHTHSFNGTTGVFSGTYKHEEPPISYTFVSGIHQHNFSGSTDSQVDHVHSVNTPTFSTASTSSGVPYIQLLACEKN